MATFRKSKKIGGLKFNFSKSGIGVSTGIKGLRIGVDSKGKAYSSVGIPGTGIYSRKNLSSSNKKKQNKTIDLTKSINDYLNEKEKQLDYLYGFRLPTEKYQSNNAKGCLEAIAWIISILLIPMGIGIITTIGLIIYRRKQNKKPKNIFIKNLNKGFNKARSKKYEEALKHLDIAETIEPNDKHLVELKGITYFQLGNYKKAKEYLEKIAKNEPSRRTNILLLETYKNIDNKDDYEKIIKIYDELIKDDPSDNESKYLIGYYLYKLGKYDQAISYLQKINEDDELYLKALIAIATCFIEKDDLNNAILVLQKAPLRKRKLDDDLKEIHYLLGSIYQEIKDKKNALKHFNKVIIDDLEYKDIKKRIEELNK